MEGARGQPEEGRSPAGGTDSSASSADRHGPPRGLLHNSEARVSSGGCRLQGGTGDADQALIGAARAQWKRRGHPTESAVGFLLPAGDRAASPRACMAAAPCRRSTL
ncbi:hypothetical protein NDU88_004487 [Pleurodeles waltl]|uniref:Uncharacterized protein n=1 Tax=Pleurodeles waltl TaxID=8319 RepID=A0AAV7VK17_PLEWA|nr:hypothetical protein NDU88_004487 [Pleurodeles waltl]